MDVFKLEFARALEHQESLRREAELYRLSHESSANRESDSQPGEWSWHLAVAGLVFLVALALGMGQA